MKFSVCFKALPFMAPLFLTRFLLQGGFSLKKPHIFPGAVLEVVSFLPWVSAQGRELRAGVEPSPLSRRKSRQNSTGA